MSTISRPGRNRRAGLVAGAILLIVVAGCSPSTATQAPTAAIVPTGTPLITAGQATAPAATATGAPLPTEPPVFMRNPAAYVEGVPYQPTIDPDAFEDGISHPFLPFQAGARWVFGGAERIVVEVLEDRKEILGISATVVRDRVFEDGELIEDTLDWYAQDVAGNVWYLGEDTAEYENGVIVSRAGSWEAGVDGAQPGIIMLGDPRVGDTYRQEFYAGEAEDIAAITAQSGSIAVEAGSWSGNDVFVTEEWTPLEPEVRERKTYAFGVGVVEARTILGGDDVVFLRSFEIPS